MTVKQINEEAYIVTEKIIIAISEIATIRRREHSIVISLSLGETIDLVDEEADEVWAFFQDGGNIY